MQVKASIITIGDELLIGQVIDTNSAWMGQELSKAGIAVIRRFAVGDVKQEIIAVLDTARSISDIILITGGLGPTKDDLTKYTLCEYFNSKLVFDESIFEMVKGFFERFKRPMPESNRGQAEVPDKCIPIKNYNGTAPGMWFDIEGKVFVSLPGVPWEMKLMMTDFVVPRLLKQFKTPHIIHKTILTQGIGESLLAERISDIENSFPPGFKLAYLPYLSSVRLRISAHGDEVTSLQHTVDELSKKLHERIGEYIWGYDEDKLEEVVGNLLRAQHKTLATAESCTGGLISYRLTSIAGASDYYYGGVISYSNKTKKEVLGVQEETLQKYGAVSEETVREMVTGVLNVMQTDFAIAVSGIAGPDGGTPEKPVGTTWIAVADRKSIISRHFHFPGNRERNMELATINSLSLLRKFMLGLLHTS